MKKIYTYLLLIIAVLLSNVNIVKAQVNKNDSLALVDLYDSTDGPHWTYNTNWLTKKPVSQWYGLYLTGNRVTNIHLYSNNLKGQLPLSLDKLTNLEYLLLQDNHLTGHIPSSLGQLSKVMYLYLFDNNLSGNIPPELSNLNKIYYLALDHNQLSGSIPPELGNFKGHEFSLNNNRLSGSIPAELGNMKNLWYLELDHNQLSGSIPAEVGNINSLFFIHLDHNQLSGSIPADLSKLKNLNNLNLNNNQLSGAIPSELGKLKLLYVMNLSYNDLSDKIPLQLGNLPLDTLDLSNNELTGIIPKSFSDLKQLRSLSLSNNKLRDTVPSFLTNLTHLKTLDIPDNHFTFDGLEVLVQHHFNVFTYNREKKIPIHQTNSKLSVYAGGTLSNNTYKWFSNGVLIATKHGDSTFTPTATGAYTVQVTNAIATELTLYSDMVSFTALQGADETNIASQTLNENRFSVYPDPAKDFVHVYFNSNAINAVINVYDINGNKLITQQTTLQKGNSISINITSLTAGTYIIETIAGKKILKQKFVKQ